MKTTITLNLPQEIRVGDYHEFSEIEETLKKFKPTPRIKVSEIGLGSGELYNEYIGIAYVGKLTDPDNKKLYQKLLKEIE